jgi:chromosome segregation ATPase
MLNKVDNPEDSKQSLETEAPLNKKCYICSKGFNFRKKHICRYCNNAVCIDHCQKARSMGNYEEPVPICDLCNQTQIKKDLEAEILSEVQSLEEELKQAKFTNQRLEREHFEKTAAVSKLENDINDLKTTSVKNLEFLEAELVGEESRNQSIKEKYEQIKKNTAEIRAEETEVTDNLNRAQEELENLRKQLEILKDTKNGLDEQLDKINSKLKGSLSIEQVKKLLCQPCSAKLSDASNNRLEAPSILEDATISLSHAEVRQSIIESVREYNQILSHQNSHPTEKANCSII